ncbi:MAG: SMC-Scp complex subunit ScpB [Chloroflexota bacterium]|nr:SMC-Scp complex subunit ScpB [Chloroflexota bacterium]
MTENAHGGTETTSPALEERAALIEALLYVAPGPVTVENLAAALEVNGNQVEEALQLLSGAQENRGLQIQRIGSRVQLVTSPDAAVYIERFLGLDLRTRLSPAAMETLAIIAYRQPVTRAHIEELRGVSSDGVLRTLLHLGLVEQGERLEQAGRPFQYRTTFDFLQYFGLNSLESLPPLGITEAEDRFGEAEEPEQGETAEGDTHSHDHS